LSSIIGTSKVYRKGDSDVSINNHAGNAAYIVVAETLAEEIHYGVYTPGGRLPAIRDMAVKKNTTYATVQQAYQYLERRGIIYRFNPWGYFVSKRMAG
jgi:DNA-binding transcriptional regulator YhcF (GntR family)